MIYATDSGIFYSFIVKEKKASSTSQHGKQAREKFSTNNSTGCDAG